MYNRYRNNSRAAVAAQVFPVDELRSQKMLFLLIAALVVYSDFYAKPAPIGHCGIISSK